MKKSKNVKFAALMLLVCAVLFCMKPVGVQASTMQTINTKRPCKSYDITGDNKKDSIQTKWAFDEYVSVIVNGKTIYKDKTPIEYDPTVRYCRFENGTPFLFIESYGVNELAQATIVYYKNSKPKSINLDFGDYGWLYGVSDLSVSGNTFTVQYSLMTGSTGFTRLKPCVFVYKDGDIKRKGHNVYDVAALDRYTTGHEMLRTSYVSTARKLTAYNDITTKDRAFSIKKGAKIKITKIYYNRKTLLVGVEYNGKFGWVKGIKRIVAYKKPLFKNLAFGD